MSRDGASNGLPETPEELTAEWLSGALGWPVRSVERQILGTGQGFLGDIVRLRLTSDSADTPASVIAKIPKRANRGTGEMLGVYEREILFFRELAPRVSARVPRIYFSHFDRDAGSEQQKAILGFLDRLPALLFPLVAVLGAKIAAGKNRKYLLIMEDLADFEPGDQLAGASSAECARVLAQIAGTHRSFWDDAQLQEKFWLLPMDLDARMRHRMFRATLPAFRAAATPELLPFLDWLERHGAHLMAAFAREAPQTLLHGDLRLDNVCLAGERCAYLDWQLTRVGPAAYDVAYFLGGALAPETSPEAERALVAEYHRALGVADYAFERFWRDYQRALVLSVLALSPTDDVKIDQGRGQAMMRRWLERLSARLRHVPIDTLLA
jgi:Ser/Thr protein kinase RdoA (MazF antagonist)